MIILSLLLVLGMFPCRPGMNYQCSPLLIELLLSVVVKSHLFNEHNTFGRGAEV